MGKVLILLVSLFQSIQAFQLQRRCLHHVNRFSRPTAAAVVVGAASTNTSWQGFDTDESDDLLYDPLLDESVAGKFTIRTCASTSCSERRRQLHLDEFATYADLYVRCQERAPSVSVTESPCLGSCRDGPCVAIEHDDYDGPVSLDGMTPDEFSKRVFVHVDDADGVERVWTCIENAIRIMAEATPSCAQEDEQPVLAVGASELDSEMRFV